MTTFSDRLRKMRGEAGLSQKDLAGDALTPGYISLLEAGKRTPSPEVVQRLAVRLGCSTTQLLTGEPSERDQRIELERAYARLAIEHGESAEARARLERLLAEDGLPSQVQDDLTLLLGRACERSGDFVAAVRVLQNLLDRALTQDTHVPVTFVGITLLRCYLDSGDLHQAVTVGEATLAAAEAQHLGETDDYFRLAATVMDAYLGLGDFLRARLWADRYLAKALGHGRPAGQAALYWNAAILAEHEGRMSEALSLCDRALGLFGELGTYRDTPRLQLDMAWLLLLDDPPQTGRAAELLEHSADALADLGSRVDRARWNWLRATTLLHLGDTETAETWARQAVELISSGGPLDQAQAHVTLSDTLSAQGRRDDAAGPLLTAFAMLSDSPAGRTTSLGWRDVAERLVAHDRLIEAVEAFRRALDGAGIRSRSEALIHRMSELAAARSPGKEASGTVEPSHDKRAGSGSGLPVHPGQ